MSSAIRLHRGAVAFTLIELMIVVVIVGILATVQLPMYSGNITAAKMSEGIAGAGTIRTAMRVYAASHGGQYPVLNQVDANALSSIGIMPTNFDGKYFKAVDYSVSSSAAAYTIQAKLEPAGETYVINQDGVESGTYQTGV